MVSSAISQASEPASASEVNEHRLDAHLAAGLDDANRDLAPVGDEDFLEHGQILKAFAFVILGPVPRIQTREADCSFTSADLDPRHKGEGDGERGYGEWSIETA